MALQPTPPWRRWSRRDARPCASVCVLGVESFGRCQRGALERERSRSSGRQGHSRRARGLLAERGVARTSARTLGAPGICTSARGAFRGVWRPLDEPCAQRGSTPPCPPDAARGRPVAVVAGVDAPLTVDDDAGETALAPALSPTANPGLRAASPRACPKPSSPGAEPLPARCRPRRSRPRPPPLSWSGGKAARGARRGLVEAPLPRARAPTERGGGLEPIGGGSSELQCAASAPILIRTIGRPGDHEPVPTNAPGSFTTRRLPDEAEQAPARRRTSLGSPTPTLPQPPPRHPARRRAARARSRPVALARPDSPGCPPLHIRGGHPARRPAQVGDAARRRARPRRARACRWAPRPRRAPRSTCARRIRAGEGGARRASRGRDVECLRRMCRARASSRQVPIGARKAGAYT